MKRYVITALSIFAAAGNRGMEARKLSGDLGGASGNQPDPELRTLAAWPDQRTGRYPYSLESQRFRLRHRGDG